MRVIDALPSILAELPVTLLVAGEFWHDKQTYLDRIERHGIADRVRLVDRYVANEEVGELFAASDLVVQPYETATQSAVTQLAFDCGRPVLVTRVGGLPETVQHGVTGYVVPPADSPAIAASVVDFFRNRRGPEMERAVEASGTRFGWDSFVSAVERVIERCDR
jgi:glycosyltransferase involved in cell wall biosynthesis